MKRLIAILFVLCTINLSAQNKFNKKDRFNTGIFLMSGGISLAIGSAATPGELFMNDGRWEPMPIWRQDARFAGIITGCSLTGTGLITALLNNDSKKRRSVIR